MSGGLPFKPGQIQIEQKKMITYILLLYLPSWMALRYQYVSSPQTTRENFQWNVITMVFTLTIGLRHEIGGDWVTYAEGREYVTSLDLLTVLTDFRKGDPAFGLISWLSPTLGGDYFVNLVCGVLFTLGLVAFCRNQPNPWLALTAAVPYLVITVAMGYTRQAVAIGLSMFGLVALNAQNHFKFLMWIIAAATFHKSAVILIPLAFFAKSRSKWATIMGIAVIGPLAFALFLQESLERLFAGYADAEMESSGAFIRVAMNVLPATLFLIWRRRFALSDVAQKFWTWMSVGALFFLPALAFSPSSTAVDRVALYWIPIQLFVWSRLPTAVSRGHRSEQLVSQCVVAYSASVLLVWLLFGIHASAWLPYKWYPWELVKGVFSS